MYRNGQDYPSPATQYLKVPNLGPRRPRMRVNVAWLTKFPPRSPLNHFHFLAEVAECKNPGCLTSNLTSMLWVTRAIYISNPVIESRLFIDGEASYLSPGAYGLSLGDTNLDCGTDWSTGRERARNRYRGTTEPPATWVTPCFVEFVFDKLGRKVIF